MIEGVVGGDMVILILLDIAVVGEGQRWLEVVSQVITSPFVGM
jgi:hypothetical protein